MSSRGTLVGLLLVIAFGARTLAQSAQLEAGTIIGGGGPATVPLVNTYVNPVVVCAANYTNNTIPIVTRVTNVTGVSFDVYLQNPSGGAVVAETVSYLVMEAGAWTIDGVMCEAHTYTSTVTDEDGSWVAEVQAYLQTYTSPVVIGQVMSANDPDWSVFWCRGNSRTNPPSSTSLYTGKTVCEDPDTTRADETVGFIVFETGHGAIAGVEFEARLGADTVLGVGTSPPYTYAFDAAFASDPLITLATMAAVDGGNGGWAQTHGAPGATSTTLYLSIDEDQIGDVERNHTSEQVGYVVFLGAVAATDCNNNGISDSLDIATCAGSAWCDDCNGNGVLDTCDIADGTSNDVNGNAIPDECEADCNINGIPDDWDIAQGTSADCNASGVPDECEADSDGDGLIDDCDGCPNDAAKIEPGVCGCGTPDTDSDLDGVPDCFDDCPNDPGKAGPGACGCGTADTDADNDGVPDCFDDCPQDPAKAGPGACGCSVADTDSDGDGVPDCLDGCPDDAHKTQPGLLGCGAAEEDADGDGVPDAVDLCPGESDQLDTDGDGTPDCLDGCPDDPHKTHPGLLGCDVSEEDADGDGVPDATDLCPGQSDRLDSDGDNVPDCLDGCPDDPNKIDPGLLGCGVAEDDDDGDGVPDDIDACPDADDALDADGDGIPDCLADLISGREIPEDEARDNPSPESDPVDRGDVRQAVELLYGVPLCPMAGLALMLMSIVGMTVSRRRAR